MDMKKILLIGASGFLGSRFYDYYRDKYEIIGLTSKELDVTNEVEVINILKKYSPDYTINTAGIIDTKVCEEQPQKSFNVNVMGNVNVAIGCKLAGSKMIYLSTEQVYNGHIKKGPYKEEDISNPITEYGRQKLEGEKRVRAILEDNLWILRLSWLFGLPERKKKIGSNIVWNIIESAIKCKSIKLSINEYRGMTYVYDIIEKISLVFDIPFGIYNIGSSNDLNTYETGKRIIDLLNIKDDILKEDLEKYKDCIRDLRMNTEKAQSVGIYFESTDKVIERCINEYGYIH